MVLRSLGKTTYSLAPMGTGDGYWHSHLSKTPQVRARILRGVNDAIPTDAELIRRWKTVADPGEVPDRDAFPFLGKSAVEGLRKQWKFLNELVVSDKPQPQAGNDPPER